LDRTIWNDGVEVTQAQLVHEHDALASNIIQRFVDGQTTGVASGLTVTVNGSNATLIDIAAGHGYSPNGDWVELAAPATSVGLSDYTLGTVNYVCAIYTEVDSRPEAHEVDGTTRNTQAARAARVRVMTEDELNALPATSSDLSIDALDRTLVIASVTAQGVGVGLVSANITNAAVPTRVLSITQPSTMTGVEVISLSEGTPTTAERIAVSDNALTTARASIRMTYSGSNVQLAYRAPGETYGSFGTATTVVDGVNPPLPSFAGRSAIVRVYSQALPRTDTSPPTVTEDLIVSDVYDEAVTRAGARDEQHRHADGATVIPASTNPHGLKLEDLGQVQRVLQTLFTGASLNGTRVQTMVPHLYSSQSAQSTNLNTKATLIWEFATQSSQRLRFYVVGVGGPPNDSWGLYVTVNARWIDDGATGAWKADDTSQRANKLFLIGTQYGWYGRTATASTWTENLNASGWDQAVVRGSLTGGVSGIVNFLRQINVGSLLVDTTVADALAARVAMTQSNINSVSTHTLLFEFTLGGTAAPQKARIYLDNFNSLAFTINARVSVATTFGGNATWTYDDSTKRASKFYFSNFQCSFQVKESGGATWLDDAWDLPVWLSSASGQYHQTYKTVYAGASIPAAAYTTPRLSYQTLPGATGRWLIEEAALAGWAFRRYLMFDGTDYHMEDALNCTWDGATWSATGGATSGAYLYRRSSNGYRQLRRSLPSATWTDTYGAGGWDLQYGVDPYTFSTDQASPAGVVRGDMMIAAEMVLTVDTGVFAVESQAINFDKASITTGAIYGVANGLLTIPFVKSVTNPVILVTDGTIGGLYSGAGTYRNFQWHARGENYPYYPGAAVGISLWCAQTAPDDATWTAGNVVFEPAIDFTASHSSVLRANIVVLGKLTQP
jgi:hypothetical protein